MTTSGPVEVSRLERGDPGAQMGIAENWSYQESPSGVDWWDVPTPISLPHRSRGRGSEVLGCHCDWCRVGPTEHGQSYGTRNLSEGPAPPGSGAIL